MGGPPPRSGEDRFTSATRRYPHYPFTLKGERTADPPLRLRNDTRFAPTRTPPTPPARFTPSPARFVSLGVALAVLCAFKLPTVSIPFSQGDPKRCGNSPKSEERRVGKECVSKVKT